jgi:hypothetical protein
MGHVTQDSNVSKTPQAAETSVWNLVRWDRPAIRVDLVRRLSTSAFVKMMPRVERAVRAT